MEIGSAAILEKGGQGVSGAAARTGKLKKNRGNRRKE